MNKLRNDRPILLVEDNPMDEALTLRAFARSGLLNPILVARDGVEALDVLFARGAHAGRTTLPQLVLLDLRLPRLDGLEVLAAMRAEDRTRTLPVVILTSSVEDVDLVRGYSLGANSYVRKPVDFAEFVSSARQLGLYWLVLNESPPSTR
jgi:two-component system response regulator